MRALAKGVDAAKIALRERVERSDLEAKVAHTSKGRAIAFEHLISSAPFPSLLKMTELPHDEASFTWNKVLVFNLGFDRKGPDSIHWMYFPQRELCFYRLGFYDNIFGTDRLSMYVEIGYPKDAVIDERVKDEMLERVLYDLGQCAVTDGHRLVSKHSVVLDPAYVHITKQSNAEVARLKERLAARGVHSFGRYGSWTYCSIEDNIVEARALAESLG